jgi:serine/threonine-protein kinase PknG
MRVCPVCGKMTAASEQFCLECGSPLEAPPAPVHTQPATAAAHTQPAAAPVAARTVPSGTAHVARTAAQGTAATATEPHCPNCGRPHRPGARFCTNCGAPLSPAVLARGQTLAGRYRITGIIGGGGMGAVYRAVDVNLPTREEPEGRSCAIKAILSTDDPDLLAAAALEREMLIRLDHPSVVRIYDIVTQNNIPFIVMALVPGQGWQKLLEQAGGVFAPQEAVRLVLGILPAFQYLHHRTPPVVYRDFKPSNAIEVKEDGGTLREVLIDLGTAIEYQPGQRVQAWGTPGFAPPEIRGIVEQTPAMDVYTIVSTLGVLVGLDLDAWGGGGVPPREDWQLPPELYDLIARGRSRDPAERFQTIDELADQLQGVARFISTADGSGRPGVVLPVQSRLFTGSIGHRTTARIAALPATDDSDPAAAAIGQAQALITAGRYTQALTAADAALGVDPSSIDAHLVKAAALTNLGRNEEAKAEIAAAGRRATPATRWRTLVVEAQAEAASGNASTAETLFQELMQLVPGEVLPKQALADLYLKTGRYQDALALFRRVVQADPANAEAILGLADSLVASGHPEEAIQALDRVSENAVRFVDAQLRLIELYLEGAPQHPDDLDRAGEAIQTLGSRVQSAAFFHLVGDWWFVVYGLAKNRALPHVEHWPDGQQHSPDERRLFADRCRAAYRRYLRQEPDAADADDVLDRIYFEVDEWL